MNNNGMLQDSADGGNEHHSEMNSTPVPLNSALYAQWLSSQVQTYNLAVQGLPLMSSNTSTFPISQLYYPQIPPTPLPFSALTLASQTLSYYNASSSFVQPSLLANPAVSRNHSFRFGQRNINSNNLIQLVSNSEAGKLTSQNPELDHSQNENRIDDERRRGYSSSRNRRDGQFSRNDDRRKDGRHGRSRSRSRSRSPVRRSDRKSPTDSRRTNRDRSRSRERSRRRDRERSRDRDRRSPSYWEKTRKRRNGSPSPPDTSQKRSPKEMIEEILNTNGSYTRCFPLEPYYKQSSLVTDDRQVVTLAEGTEKMASIREAFYEKVLKRCADIRASKPQFSFPPRPIKLRSHQHHDACGLFCESDVDSDIEEDDRPNNSAFEELQRKRSHPWRLHDELWYNDKGEMNDGPVCRCSLTAQRSGIRHGIYLGEEPLPKCDPNTNNRNRLYHYLISIKPIANFLTDSPTVIEYDGHSYFFEGYSLFSHCPILSTFPSCKIIRFNIEYTIDFVEAEFPQNFCIGDIDNFANYVFYELLELVDLDLKAKNDTDGCNRFHFMPRFTRLLPDSGKELLSMSAVFEYLCNNSDPIIDEENVDSYRPMNDDQWDTFAKKHKGYLVSCPGMKPSSIRIDQIDREQDDLKTPAKVESTPPRSNNDEIPEGASVAAASSDDKYPVIVHFGVRPPQLSYAGNPKYQKAWRDYVKYRHLLANKDRVSFRDKQVLVQKEEKLQEIRAKSDLKRDVTVVVSSRGFYRTGLQCDIVQHTLLIPVLVCHLRFQYSLQHLEMLVGYEFKDRSILQLALTHPSYRENFGTNPDHARNTLTNCGLRHVLYGDRRVHFMNTRKRGINMLINIMSRFGCNEETVSNINHNERLEFLGDAVVEFLTSIHLFFLFPELEEGGLATYRAALVQNQHLAVLAKKLQLEKFMLYAHGSDLCHDLELRHAMANCFEAFMGALFLDGGIEVADAVFSRTLFDDQTEESRILYDLWVNYSRHPLQLQYPDGDRHLVREVPRLQELVEFEEIIGVQFTHIRLLARAFTHRSVGYNNLTIGSNQRMEFLGDTVLQLVSSQYLYRFFPDHHEGHLSLLRSSLVNNKTQSVVCDDLGMNSYTQYVSSKMELKTKDRADLLEAFLGALYVDKGIEHCRRFCEVCFFPRLEDFIMNQDWNDPKSKLQQCCLTLRSPDGGEPDIPLYKVIESKGPTNTRIYVVAVYFRGRRLATGKGHSIQEAEMNAATNALNSSKTLFPHLFQQKKATGKNNKKD